jgi:hypothetical protein
MEHSDEDNGDEDGIDLEEDSDFNDSDFNDSDFNDSDTEMEHSNEDDSDLAFFDHQLRYPEACRCIVGHKGKGESCTCCGDWIRDIFAHLEAEKDLGSAEYRILPIDQGDLAMLCYNIAQVCTCQLPDGLGNPREQWMLFLNKHRVFCVEDSNFKKGEGTGNIVSLRALDFQEMVAWQEDTTYTVEDLEVAWQSAKMD